MTNLKKVLAGSILINLVIAGCGTSNNNFPQQNIAFNPAPQQLETVDAAARKYSILEIRGIGDVYQGKLKNVGISNTEQLLKATAKRKDRKILAEKTGISEKLLLRWANHVDLMRVKGIGPIQSNWLEAVGVDSIPELAKRRSDNLHERLEIANNIDPKRKFVHRMPGQGEVQKWIDSAKATEPSVEVSH